MVEAVRALSRRLHIGGAAAKKPGHGSFVAGAPLTLPPPPQSLGAVPLIPPPPSAPHAPPSSTGHPHAPPSSTGHPHAPPSSTGHPHAAVPVAQVGRARRPGAVSPSAPLPWSSARPVTATWQHGMARDVIEASMWLHRRALRTTWRGPSPPPHRQRRRPRHPRAGPRLTNPLLHDAAEWYCCCREGERSGLSSSEEICYCNLVACRRANRAWSTAAQPEGPTNQRA
jgi:hypothetical protein